MANSIDEADGDNRDPVFFDDLDRRTSAFPGAGEQRGRTCWAIDVESVYPGMARIKMALDDGGRAEGSPILKHDFLVIWLNMSNPDLTELSSTAFPGYDVGDPTGDGNFFPIAMPGDDDYVNGLVRVRVTGSFVDLHNTARTLPADWAALAARYAADTDDYNPMRWDIHDDQLETEGHTADSFCAADDEDIDAVDNCLGGSEIGAFSRVIGGTFATVGPFDPVRPGSSFLPDGKLDAGDAPMPSARIDLDLTGTVGSLEAADKHVLYSRNRTGSASAAYPNNEHNLYAPFYVSLIPADVSSLAGSAYTTSGTHGTIANNFPGYQVGPIEGLLGVYHYWDLVNTDERSGSNECYDVGGEGQVSDSDAIPLPNGIDEATVYTDEHGEAIVQFNPDVGVGLTPNNQGLCDLGEINGPALLGSALITAEARDPFQLTFNDRRTDTLTKNVYELAGKSLDCVPKNPIEVFCVEVIRDIRGNPVSGAKVIFSADPMDRILGANLELGGYDTRGAQCNAPNASDEVTCYTNELGQAGVVIIQTRPDLVNVVAENARTRNGGFGVTRDRCVRFFGNGATLPTDGPNCATPTDGGTTIPVTPVTPVTPTTPSSNNGVAAVTSTATVVSLAGTSPVAATAPAAKAKAKATAKLASAKLVVVKGKRYLVVRANGTAKSVKLRIILVMKTGKVMKPVVRTVRTNRAIRVAGLQISKHVRTVRVSAVR